LRNPVEAAKCLDAATGKGGPVAIFGRRRKLGVWEKARRFLAPPGGMGRAWRYLLHRVKRLPATPHAIAAGFASGAAASCLPLIGFHFLLSFALAWVVRGSMVAAALGTAVGNPLTFPLLYAGAYRLGRLMANPAEPVVAALDAQEALEEITDAADHFDVVTTLALLPVWRVTLIGSLPIAAVAFLVFYFPVRALAQKFQARRRARLGLRKVA
jgi:uncharacterized protein (DUF2062 family)